MDLKLIISEKFSSSEKSSRVMGTRGGHGGQGDSAVSGSAKGHVLYPAGPEVLELLIQAHKRGLHGGCPQSQVNDRERSPSIGKKETKI